MRKIINTVLAVAALILALGLLLAIGDETERQVPQKRPSGMDIGLSSEEIPHLVEIIRVWKLVDELGLNEDQLVKFLPNFKKQIDLVEEYSRNRREIVTTLSELLETNASAAELKSAIDKVRNSERNFFSTYGELNDALEANLNVKQQAKFIIFQDRYRRDMKRLTNALRKLSD